LDNAVIFKVSIPWLKYHENFGPLRLTSSRQLCGNAHDYIRMEITVLYLKFHGINFRFDGRKYPFTGSAIASPINSI